MIKFFDNFKSYLRFFLKGPQNKESVTIYPNNKVKGRVLVSYLLKPALLNKNDKELDGHSNKWESREIVRIFAELGYIVDVIDFHNHYFFPKNKYDIIFDIHTNLQRLLPFLGDKTLKILHMTGSYAKFQNSAEIKRVDEFERRKKVFYSPKRLDFYEHLVERSLKYCDICSLIGNDFILNTYPEKYKNKMHKVTVSASNLDYIKNRNDFVPEQREFLWFFGGGAVHKGLDLVLDVFSKNKNLKLNVIGVAKNEPDFWKAYKSELTDFSNIKYHGFLLPNEKKFIEIVKRVFCFIAPSCSESISTSVATCLQIGLFPIVSRNTGVDLPDNCGIFLENCSVEEIESVVKNVYDMKEEVLKNQILSCQNLALKKYSRDKFRTCMTNFILKAIDLAN